MIRLALERRLRHADEYLRAHRLTHRVDALITDAAPEDVILDEVRRRRPRLLVLDTHGHRPIMDLFVTSLTSAVLNRAPVPVFTGA